VLDRRATREGDLLIFGLGNPWLSYQRTRHCLGAAFVTELCAQTNGGWDDDGRVHTATVIWCNRLTHLARGNADINISGQILSQLLDRDTASDIWVVYDDATLPLGQIRLTRRGGDGGHGGVRSILSELGPSEFSRLRLGIGSPRSGKSMVEWVSGQFTADEQAHLRGLLSRARDALALAIAAGLEKAQTRFHADDQ
jgi:PTH1 family peptidyl-tRNA hydrolase